MSQVKDLIEHLQKDFKPDDFVAYSLWNIDDVEEIYKESGSKKKLTEEQKIDVLEKTQHYFDAGIGINWDVIRFHLDDVLAGN